MKLPKEQAPDASDANHAAYVNGCKLYEQGHYSQALGAFSEALEYWPEDAQAWWAKGNCYDELRKPAKAEACFREALSHAQAADRAPILLNLGNVLFDQGRYPEAIKFYTEISSQSKIWPKAQRNIELARNGG